MNFETLERANELAAKIDHVVKPAIIEHIRKRCQNGILIDTAFFSFEIYPELEEFMDCFYKLASDTYKERVAVYKKQLDTL